MILAVARNSLIPVVSGSLRGPVPEATALILFRIRFVSLHSISPSPFRDGTVILHRQELHPVGKIVYCVKFSFLVVFRHLIDRLPGLTSYWKAVVVACAISFAFAMSSPFIGCPYFGLESGMIVVALSESRWLG